MHENTAHYTCHSCEIIKLKMLFSRHCQVKLTTASKDAYLANDYHTGHVLGCKNMQETSAKVFLYSYLASLDFYPWRSAMQQIKPIPLSSAWQEPCGDPPERFQKWEAVKCDQNKDRASADGDEWQQMNHTNVTKPQQNPDAGVLHVSSLNRLMSELWITLEEPRGWK